MHSRQTAQPMDGPTNTNNKKDALLNVKFFEKQLKNIWKTFEKQFDSIPMVKMIN